MARNDVELTALVEQAKREGAGKPAGFTFWDMSDAALVRLQKAYLRELEDIATGESRQYPAPILRAWLDSIRWVRLVRWCLRMRYGAVDEHVGTKSWDRYNRFDDAPTYSLAIDVDKLRWSLRNHPSMPARGTRRHIIDWDRFGDGQPHRLMVLSAVPS